MKIQKGELMAYCTSCRFWRTLFVVMATVVGLTAKGDDVRNWTRNTAKDTTPYRGGTAAFTDLSYWVDAQGQVGSGTPTANDVFVFAGARLRHSFEGTFAGKSLQIGTTSSSASVVHDNDKVLTFVNEGLFLQQMSWGFNQQSAQNQAIGGPITILDGTSSRPVVFHIMQEQYFGCTATLSGTLSGGSNAQVLFGPLDGVIYDGKGAIVCASNSTFVVNDLSGYQGTIRVSSKHANVVTSDGRFSQFGTYLKLGSATSAAKIIIDANGVLGTCGASDKVTVGELSFADGSYLCVTGQVSETSSMGLIRATAGLQLSGKLPVYVNTAFLNCGRLRMPVLSWPSSQSFTEDDFELVRGNNFCNPDMHFEIGDDAEVSGNSSLYVVTYGVVSQLRCYPYEDSRNVMQNSSLTNATAWSDRKAVHDGSAYRSTSHLRSLTDNTCDYTFPGAWYWQESGSFLIACRTFTVPEFYAGSFFADNEVVIGEPQSGPSIATIKANGFHFVRGKVILRCYEGRTMVFDGELDGGANVELQGWSTTGSPEGKYAFKGNNTNFTGRLVFNQQVVDPAYCNFTHSQTLLVYDGRNLGGRLPESDPRALTVTHFGLLSMEADDIVLASGLNRGLYVQGCGRVNVSAANRSCEIHWPILLSGEFWKQGAGALLLGGAMRHEVEDGGAISDVPRANSNLVIVAGGALKIAHADALAGAETVFSNGTQLVIRYDATDDSLRQYGIRNTTVDHPFVLGSAMGGKLPLTLDVSAISVPTEAIAPTLGLFTVRDDAANEIEAMLPSRIKLWPRYSSKIVKVHDVGSSTTTFAVASQMKGIVLIVR